MSTRTKAPQLFSLSKALPWASSEAGVMFQTLVWLPLREWHLPGICQEPGCPGFGEAPGQSCPSEVY